MTEQEYSKILKVQELCQEAKKAQNNAEWALKNVSYEWKMGYAKERLEFADHLLREAKKLHGETKEAAKKYVRV